MKIYRLIKVKDAVTKKYIITKKLDNPKINFFPYWKDNAKDYNVKLNIKNQGNKIIVEITGDLNNIDDFYNDNLMGLAKTI